MEFLNQKELRLKKNDMSRKGTIDEKIVDLVDYLNSQTSYVTTSSCSGRISVFTNSEHGKKGCNWIFMSHDVVLPQNILDSLKSHEGSAILKFEPFILHVQCSSLESAQKLHVVSIESGFRNSGLTISKKGNIIVAIRSTLSLEVPLSHEGVLLVSDDYISFVVSTCNKKMKENWLRTERLFSGIRNSSVQSLEVPKVKQPSEVKYRRNDHDFSKKTSPKDDCISADIFYDGFDSLLKLAET